MERLKNRDDALDAVKGFAIIIVMLGHCMVLNGLSDPYVYDAIAAIQMPLFMTVSGFTVGRKPLSLKEKPQGRQWLSRLGRRTAAYLLPFFSWLVLTHLTNPIKELRLQLFALDRGLWFLMTLWIITLVTMLASYVADYAAWKRNGKGVLRFLLFSLLVGLCYLGFVLQARSGNTFLSPSLTVKYLPFYVGGYFWGLYVAPLGAFAAQEKGTKLRRLGHKGAIPVWIASLVVFGYLVAAYDMIQVSDTETLMAQMTASALGSFVCFYGVYHFAKGAVKKALAFIGQYTLEIYVLHFRFARLLGIGNKELQMYSIRTAGWILAAFAVMSVLTAACIWIIKRFHILDFLLFGKWKAS